MFHVKHFLGEVDSSVDKIDFLDAVGLYLGLNKTVAVHSYIVLLFNQFVNNEFLIFSLLQCHSDKNKFLELSI